MHWLFSLHFMLSREFIDRFGEEVGNFGTTKRPIGRWISGLCHRLMSERCVVPSSSGWNVFTNDVLEVKVLVHEEYLNHLRTGRRAIFHWDDWWSKNDPDPSLREWRFKFESIRSRAGKFINRTLVDYQIVIMHTGGWHNSLCTERHYGRASYWELPMPAAIKWLERRRFDYVGR